ncbi:MAG TPA: phospholipase D-like domain-containing protein [bacterium]|nr:phospholipase D-like domain-containing protein [bacterium]
MTELNKAKKSIEIIMYLIEYNEEKGENKIEEILNTLIKKRKEGVNVLVILSADNYGNIHLKRNNEKVKEYLEEGGVSVFINYGSQETHDKLVVIDDRIVFIGAHNFSIAALFYNNELSLLLKADTDIPQIKEYVKKTLDKCIYSKQKNISLKNNEIEIWSKRN